MGMSCFKSGYHIQQRYRSIALLVVTAILAAPQGSNKNASAEARTNTHSQLSLTRQIPPDTARDASGTIQDAPGQDIKGAEPRPDSLFRRQDSDSGGLASDADSTASAADSLPRAKGDSAGRMFRKPVRPVWLYPGLSIEQDSLARTMLASFYRFDWQTADKIGKKMQRLEKKRRLPPLSFLLRVGMRVIRLQNGEYQHERTARELLQEAKKLAKRGLRVSDPERAADSVLATSLFINGGIRGFIATLEIDKNPINAALSGFAAQKQLEESLAHDSSIVDAWLGLGLFSCALAKAPLLVRGALAMIGKEVSLSKGQNCLRRSAYHGRYTNDIAKLYLIQFLSPYWGHEAVEKKRIFRALQRDYPANPLYLFLELEEDLCFHPKALFRFAYKSRVRKQTAAFKTDNYETRRYAELVKWQYLLIDPFPFQGMIPDPSFDLRGFSYYPVFLRALREKYVYKREGGEKANDRMRRLKYIRAHALEATRTLETTLSMSASRKSFFLWHIQDALGLPGESAAGNK